jgi:hypothetical protein
MPNYSLDQYRTEKARPKSFLSIRTSRGAVDLLMGNIHEQAAALEKKLFNHEYSVITNPLSRTEQLER